MGKILTLQDLFSFCEQNNLVNFNAKETGSPVVVSLFADLEENKKDAKGLMFAKVKVCHTELNRNNSYISEENMRKAMPSLKNRPFLAAIHQLDNGEYDFHTHDIEHSYDEDGNEVTTYIERQIGSFTEDEPVLEYDEEYDKTYVIANVVIPEEYTMAADIIRRRGGKTKVSCEICVEDFSYNAKEKYIEINDFYFLGCTALGHRKDGSEVMEGMRGSSLTIADFSAELVKYSYENRLIEVLEKMEKTLSNFNNINDYITKGGEKLKLEELLAKYEKTIEDITFEYEGLTDEELEAKFAEEFETEEIVEEIETEAEIEEVVETAEAEETMEIIENVETPEFVQCSMNLGENTYNFEVSLNDKIYALSLLVNATYSEADNAYYNVRVYDNYVVMIDWWTDKAYRQTYEVLEDNNYSLTGERVSVYANYLTKEEEEALENLRNSFASLQNEIAEYERKEKERILASEDYAVLAENTEFKELNNNLGNYSVAEVSDKADAILGRFSKTNPDMYAKPNKLTYTFEHNEVKSPYGDLFASKN